ncbi:hypothetical protein AB0M29_44410 [Streptomyces sp. NPDC051976]|uniref:hypothetical protein n=1 Tax=Streptomyces sp. NPDC051976 TaxID=3154947 RepID=UPI0034431741
MLALTHDANSPIWQLADTCHGCCAAIPGTAAVPQWSPTRPSADVPDAPSKAQQVLEFDKGEEQTQVWDDAAACW